MRHNTIVLRCGLLKGFNLTEEFTSANLGLADELSDLLEMQALTVGSNLENKGNRALKNATVETLRRCHAAGLHIVNATDSRDFGTFADVEQAVNNSLTLKPISECKNKSPFMVFLTTKGPKR